MSELTRQEEMRLIDAEDDVDSYQRQIDKLYEKKAEAERRLYAIQQEVFETARKRETE